jgi:hypothetical protein
MAWERRPLARASTACVSTLAGASSSTASETISTHLGMESAAIAQVKKPKKVKLTYGFSKPSEL